MEKMEGTNNSSKNYPPLKWCTTDENLVIKIKKNMTEVTAKWAREKAISVLGVKVSEQISKCENGIKSAVGCNKMSCSIGLYAEKLTLNELEKRGFKCEQHDDQRDGSYLTITW